MYKPYGWRWFHTVTCRSAFLQHPSFANAFEFGNDLLMATKKTNLPNVFHRAAVGFFLLGLVVLVVGFIATEKSKKHEDQRSGLRSAYENENASRQQSGRIQLAPPEDLN